MPHAHITASVAVLAAAVALIAAPTVFGHDKNSNRDDKQPSPPHFSARDTRRTYGFTCSGTASGMPFAQLGVVSCDGIDTCKATGITNQHGKPDITTLVGKYTIDSDGLGFINYDVSVGGVVVGQLPIEFVLIDGGREVRGLPLVPGFSVLCELKEQ
jgi:hypothetical protein